MKLWSRRRLFHVEVFHRTKRTKRHWMSAVRVVVKMKLRQIVMEMQWSVADHSISQLRSVHIIDLQYTVYLRTYCLLDLSVSMYRFFSIKFCVVLPSRLSPAVPEIHYLHFFIQISILGYFWDTVFFSACLQFCFPFSSNRQHLSYDGCLEVRGEIIRTVLCCIVYWSCAQS